MLLHPLPFATLKRACRWCKPFCFSNLEKGLGVDLAAVADALLFRLSILSSVIRWKGEEQKFSRSSLLYCILEGGEVPVGQDAPNFLSFGLLRKQKWTDVTPEQLSVPIPRPFQGWRKHKLYLPHVCNQCHSYTLFRAGGNIRSTSHTFAISVTLTLFLGWRKHQLYLPHICYQRHSYALFRAGGNISST